MMKRVFWFSTGAVTGAAGVVYGYVRVRRSAGRPAAERVVNAVADTARTGVDGARRFVDDARHQIQRVEDEMRQGSSLAGDEPSVTSGDGGRRDPRNGRSG
jgi:hypothetical protein